MIDLTPVNYEIYNKPFSQTSLLVDKELSKKNIWFYKWKVHSTVENPVLWLHALCASMSNAFYLTIPNKET